LAIFDVNLYEPVRPGVNADTLAYSADNATWPTADGGLLDIADNLDAISNVISAEIYEPIHPGPGADTTLYTADETQWPTADGGIIEGATESVDAVINVDIGIVFIYEYGAASDDQDAEIISAIAEIGGGYYPRPRPAAVIGYGYGVLSELEGEAVGAIGIIGLGLGTFPRLSGSAIGASGTAGRSVGQIILRASAIGQRGQVGIAIGILECALIASDGATVTRGQGSGTIAKLNGIAVGRYDDDEAAMMTFLLAA
jgi:hypothetical protein